MVKHIFFVLFVFLPLSGTFASDSQQEAGDLINYNSGDSSKFQEVYINALKQLKPSFSGKTPVGNKYNLYAIKRTKGWNFLILDSSSYYSFRQEKTKDKTYELVENNESYTNMLCLAAQAKSLKLISKPKNVSGLTFSCYYKFRPKAKKMYRTFVKVQGKAKFFETNMKNGPAGKAKIFNSLMK